MPLALAGYEGGGGEGGGGEGGGGEGEDRQQAFLHFPESFVFFARHNFVQLLRFCESPLHPLVTRLLSLVLHVVSSLSAAQSFGDGEGVAPSARPRLISGSIFAVTSKATSGVVDGATAPTQLSTLRAASRHLKSGILIICVFRAHGFEPVRHAG